MYKINDKDQLIVSKPKEKDRDFYIRITDLYGWDEPMIIDDWYFDHSYRFDIVQICGYLYIYDAQFNVIYDWPLSQSVQNPIRELLNSLIDDNITCEKSKDQIHLLQCLEGGF